MSAPAMLKDPRPAGPTLTTRAIKARPGATRSSAPSTARIRRMSTAIGSIPQGSCRTGDYRETMDTGLYIAASGMLAQQVREDQLANDLSNASTPGYKSDSSVQSDFGSMLLANTANGQSVGSINTGVQLGAPVTNLTPSTLYSTNQPLDF